MFNGSIHPGQVAQFEWPYGGGTFGWPPGHHPLRLLGQMGYRADLACNGVEALEAVARQTYDLVLMNVQMRPRDRSTGASQETFLHADGLGWALFGADRRVVE